MEKEVMITRRTIVPQHQGATLTRLKTALLLAPFVAGTLANAQEAGVDQLANEAKTQMGTVVSLLVGILVVGIGVTVLFFANRNTKRGVNSAG